MNKLLAVLVLLSLCGCALGSDDKVQVTISFDRTLGSAPDGVPVGRNSLTAPTSLSSFTCLVVNVMGSGVASNESEALMAKKHDHLAGGGYCSYTGVVSSPVTLGKETDVTLLINKGKQRYVQLLGIVDSKGKLCSSTSAPSSATLMADSDVYAYELARTTVADLSYSQEVTLQTAYNALSTTERDLRLAQCTETLEKWTSRSSSTLGTIAVGNAHGCAVTSAGGVKCWGTNSDKQVGDGTTTQRLTAVDVTGLTGVSSITGQGGNYTCALTTAGGVKCWGDNTYGQLGDGTTTDRGSPVDVIGLTSGVKSVVAGYSHACAVTTAGAAKCWGYNTSKQLGDNTTTASSTPVSVAGLSSGVSAIGVGDNHSCAVLSTGALHCWGYNSNGQMGVGTTGGTQGAPTQVTGLSSGIKAFAGGYAFGCALLDAGSLKCWGENNDGQFGDGTDTQVNTPVSSSSVSGTVTAHFAANGQSCAIFSTGEAKCWGKNLYGQLGNGTTTGSFTPVSVSGASSGVTDIAMASQHTCAKINGTVKCWGFNSGGNLGDGTTTQRTTPTAVSGL